MTKSPFEVDTRPPSQNLFYIVALDFVKRLWGFLIDRGVSHDIFTNEEWEEARKKAGGEGADVFAIEREAIRAKVERAEETDTVYEIDPFAWILRMLREAARRRARFDRVISEECKRRWYMDPFAIIADNQREWQRQIMERRPLIP